MNFSSSNYKTEKEKEKKRKENRNEEILRTARMKSFDIFQLEWFPFSNMFQNRPLNAYFSLLFTSFVFSYFFGCKTRTK